MIAPELVAMRTVALVLLGLACGCITHPQRPAATQPATAIDVATAQPDFWYDRPATSTASAADFESLWRACEDVARDFLFTLDRADYRSGVLTTRPLVSGQWFEPWRRDARDEYDRQESSIATIRRTIRFEFTRRSDDTWQVAPKVLVERNSIAEKRITSVVGYRSAFTTARRLEDRPTGTRESDRGINLPERYWYPVRRDTNFERALVQAVQKRLSASRA